MSLRIYNTLTRQKEDFVPTQEGKVGMYVCGVTVYDYCHVGHARAAVVFDTIYRYLQYLGYEVTYVRNFTDIDDKIIERAQKENIPWTQVTKKYIQAFNEDIGCLNAATPSKEPKATSHIEDMTAMIAKLVENGKAYERDGDVYYSIKTFEPYGRLSGKNIDELVAGARVNVDERKQNPLDFALWKKSKPGEPAWKSPWGEGRPGWHIECSAMGRKFLGEQFDIHGGGKDLVFPHHENEIAQSQGTSGKPPVKYWMHNGFVNIDQEKMSKSLNNFFSLRDIYKNYLPEVLRFFLLTVHYRSPIDFSQQSLKEAEKVLGRFYEFLSANHKTAKTAGGWGSLTQEANSAQKNEQPFIIKFKTAMDDDFNSALALAHMNDELRDLNKTLNSIATSRDEQKWQAFYLAFRDWKQAGETLGLFSMQPDEFKNAVQRKKIEELDLNVEKVEALIEDRNNARAAKDWEKADACREELSKMDITLEDTTQGTTWKVK
ncbi:MAG: cysteine--tRNA ligase [Nitrospinota bacterium]|nr:cysteine--tRNA ligase [Nitrospinota bacterium]